LVADARLKSPGTGMHAYAGLSSLAMAGLSFRELVGLKA